MTASPCHSDSTQPALTHTKWWMDLQSMFAQSSANRGLTVQTQMQLLPAPMPFCGHLFACAWGRSKLSQSSSSTVPGLSLLVTIVLSQCYYQTRPSWSLEVETRQSHLNIKCRSAVMSDTNDRLYLLLQPFSIHLERNRRNLSMPKAVVNDLQSKHWVYQHFCIHLTSCPVTKTNSVIITRSAVTLMNSEGPLTLYVNMIDFFSLSLLSTLLALLKIASSHIWLCLS